jgi:hypothetical protein
VEAEGAEPRDRAQEIDTAPHKERVGVGKGVTIDRLVAAE